MPIRSCLICNAEIAFKKRGWFSKGLDIKGFCGGCGVEFHNCCPRCHEVQVDLAKFCSSCGCSIYVEIKPISSQVFPVQNVNNNNMAVAHYVDKRVINNLRNDLNDSCYFAREAYVVIWRLNPLNLMFHDFSGYMSSMDNSMDNSQKLNLVSSAINSISFDVMVDGFTQLLEVYKNAIVESFEESLIKLKRYNLKIYNYVVQSVSLDVSSIVDDVYGDVYRAINSGSSDYELIVRRYRQLVEFYPRYESIMTRNGILEMAFAFAAGFFVGPLAVSGLEVWEGWRSSNDEEFMSKFSCAIDGFAQVCVDFTCNVENRLGLVFDSFIDEYKERELNIIKQLEYLVDAKWDLNEFYVFFSKPEPLDDDGRSFSVLVIDNLKNRGDLSRTQIQNIKRLIGLI
jgi:hypothetical protein